MSDKPITLNLTLSQDEIRRIGAQAQVSLWAATTACIDLIRTEGYHVVIYADPPEAVEKRPSIPYACQITEFGPHGREIVMAAGDTLADAVFEAAKALPKKVQSQIKLLGRDSTP